MFKLILLNYVILPLVSSVEWELVVDDLNAATFGLGSWQFKNACTGGGGGTTGSVGACQTNSNSYIQIQDNIFRTYQTYANDIPHYQVRVLTDFYIQGSSGGGQTLTIYLENTAVSSFSYTSTTLLDYNPVCVTSNSTNFQIRTYIVEATHTNNQNILIQYCTSINNSGKWVGIRNLQIYIHRCYYTCSQCDGPTQNDCTNCYKSGSGPTCQPCSTSTTGNRFTDYTVNLNCQSECDRNGKLADSNYVCQTEPRISQQGTYFTGSFTSYSDPPWKFIADPLFFDPTVPTSKVSICSSTKFMGFFRFNEAMELTFTLATQVQYIRLRVTFYMANWQDNTSIQVLMDQIPMVVVKSLSGVIQLTNAIKISSGTCGSYTTYRIEAIILKTSNSPKLKLKGNMDVTTTQSWGFSEFYIDVAVCQINCSVCKNSEECYTCSATYRVYKGTCVQTCPPYSQSSTNAQGNVCIDYDEETAQSQYLLKAFYDTTTTDDEVIALVGTVSTTGSPNFQTNGYYWSYIPGKRVLGGSLVWYKAKFVKSFTIPDPHYLVRVRMKVILGDGMTGNFYYQFYNLSNVTVTTTNVGTTSNLWGKAANEKTIPLDFPVQHDDITPSSFSVTLHCQSVATNIYDGFCAVSDYFLVVHYCAPYCNACTGPNPADCTSQQSLPANMLTFDPLKCNNNYFLDKSVLPYICTQCATGCQECTSTTVCTTCKTNFSLIANTCYCNQGLFLSGTICQNCNSICQNCYGANANQCLGCYPVHNRYLSKNVCLCNTYYYDDGFNIACLPICGDMIVVEGEACDDGNDIPYDGCHKCQYSCQLECSNCVKGECVKCKSGWEQIQYKTYFNEDAKKCKPISGDLKIVGQEECDDGNIGPYDGCYQSKFQCDVRCVSCIYGKCQSCDSANGWILNKSLSICESQCSDLIVAKTEFCDDANLSPFDGCFACAYSCPLECSVCTLGQCQQCKSGYTYNSQFKSCSMTCGDAVKLPNEICDDGNLAPYDGCYKCQYSCQPECTNCVQGICLACNTSGWELNNQMCQPKCGDGIETLQIEQCDDGNDTPFDGCFQCKESCQTECLNCHQGQCRMCIPTFYLNTSDYLCYPKCGDMLVVSNEECDDGNNIDFDGCSNCKNQCQSTCTKCVKGICQECNAIGYYLSSQSKCESICGDTIIVNDEECDDGNNEEFDGCFQCKWQCQQECLTCGRGICEKCKNGYYLEGGLCSSICGDSIISKGEQCDDGNYLQSDGCFQCQFQCQEECTNCVLGICYQCQVGFSLATNKRCQSVCGDGILTKYEECDEIERDSIHTFQSQCYQCKLQCQSSCLTCSQGICLNCDESQGWYLNQGFCETKCTDLILAGNEECEGISGCKFCNFDCPTDCDQCQYGVCQQCKPGFYLQDNNTCSSICGDSFIVSYELCDDDSPNQLDVCHKCKYSCQLECSDCFQGRCVKCITGWYFNEGTQKCQPICGDMKIIGTEECDDGNITPYDGCYQCKYQCDSRCTSCIYGKCLSCDSANGWVLNKSLSLCESQCNDLIVARTEQCDDDDFSPFDGCFACAHSCPMECSLCTLGLCQECILGYTYDSQSQSCSMTCGDAVKLPNEICDDGNLAPYDGCYKCQYSCQPECTNCVQGICLACNTSGWELNNQMCQPKCGDGIETLQIEQCDDGNDTPFDGCFQCKESCQTECLNCHQGQCRMCIPTFYLNTSDYLCYPKCGDMLVVSNEECDDGNNIDFDGCSNCKNQCQSTCTKCVKGICQECNTIGYYLSSQSKCESICGDTIIVNDEECDDGNNEEFDGCFQCKWQCQQECLTCGRGICEKCKNGYYLEGGLCSSICGDSIISKGEQCDDGNYLQSDGCFQCQFQCQEECTNCVLGICYQCQVGFSLATNKRCQSVCGDGILTKYEECDEIERDSIHTFQSQCYQCKLQCQSSCLTCSQGICLNCDESQGWYLNQGFCETKCTDLILAGNEECEGISGCKFCNFDCPTDCDQCKYGVCQQCKPGFYLQDNNTCSSICGDSFIVSYELCDDDNLNPFDGCFSCQFSCVTECSLCYYGQCQQCQQGYQLTDQGNCEPKCGDLIVLAIEQCDDGNQVPYDGCHLCKYQCQLECVQCLLGICYECQFGYGLDSDNQCQSICGDQYVTSIEQCDDGNLIASDGCYLCQFDYQLECIEGNDGLCIRCSQGYFLNNQSQCEAICGDGITVSNEQCDDTNYLQFDGCYECQFQCQIECSDCMEGICQNCFDGYALNTWNQCESICGDNIKVLDEECDDNSLECVECKLKCNFGCQVCVHGICYQCLDGWNLDEQSICQSQCGDKQLTVQEQCDDGNLIQNDGCNQCQYQCSLHCINCSYGICLLCDIGYQLIEIDHYLSCQPICGDLIVVESEQCDDGNLILSDGCDLCQFSCTEQCDNCIGGVCLSCQYGYHLNLDNQCISVCGDQIVALKEYCDDGNENEFDGCYQCNYSCQQECEICSEGQCLQCLEGFQLNLENQCVTVCGDQLVKGQEQCDDGNLIAFDGCFECQYDCQSQCQICIDAYCLQCNNELGWYLNPFGFCETLCGDNIVSSVESCDDGNEIRYDGCYECKFECQSVCTQCLLAECYECNTPGWYLIDKMCHPFCGDSITVDWEQCDDGNDEMYDGCYECEFQCEEMCNLCMNGVCFGCVLGWAIDPVHVCQTVCGDSLVISPQEDCDDGNVIPYDGCYDCKFSCEELCTECILGVCYECNHLGWQINNDENKCEPICNDGLVLGTEECDDMNLIPFDGCFECKFQCEEKCNLCINGVCHGCVLGWAISELNICQTVCGDSIVISPQEDCDDGNLEPYDGCYECVFQCEELCTTCIEGVCYECDNIGWQINNEHKCEPICNDGLVMGIEECDDMNLIPYDGCFECKFQCHQKCLECKQGVCQKCDYGYYIFSDQCKNFCGDGKKADNELCDDNNLNDMDGCSKECQIEDNWFCITQEHDISQCVYSKLPELKLSLGENNSTQTQIVNLKFDVEMKMVSIFIEPQFLFKILNLLDTDYTIQLIPLIPLAIQAKFVEYNLYINFNISVYSPTLIVEVQNVTNQYQQTFSTIHGKLKLRDIEVLSEGEKKATLAAQSFSEVVMYTMVGIGTIAIMTGSLEMVWNLLDMLQLLSYIKYVNIDFPLNLDTYFEIFKLVTISPLLKLLGVDTILSAMNDGESPYVETENKFKDDNINAYFLGNFSSFLLCFILAYINYFFSLIMSKLLFKLGPWALRKLNFTLLKVVHKSRIFFKKTASGFYYSALMRIFLANYYDIMFAACIQVNNLNWENVNMSINSGLSILVLGGQAYFIFNIASKLTSFINRTTFSNKVKYDSIFEGVQDNKANFWGMQLNSILLLKKFMFMVIIVNCQGDGAIQTMYVSISSTMYLAYLIKTKPFNSKSELIKQIINESALSFNALTFMVYKYQRLLQLDHSEVMIMGWIHIVSFSGILCSTLIIDLYNQMQNIFKKIKQSLKKKEEVPVLIFY